MCFTRHDQQSVVYISRCTAKSQQQARCCCCQILGGNGDELCFTGCLTEMAALCQLPSVREVSGTRAESCMRKISTELAYISNFQGNSRLKLEPQHFFPRTKVILCVLPSTFIIFGVLTQCLSITLSLHFSLCSFGFQLFQFKSLNNITEPKTLKFS